MLIYDMLNQLMTAPEQINPSLSMQAFMFEDYFGYNNFQLCRTSDLENGEQKSKGLTQQRTKYQLFTFFNEKVGIIQVQEYLITHSGLQNNSLGVHMSIIGQKQLIFSN